MVIDLRLVINKLVDIGFYSVILPFLLVYVIVFAVLEKSRIFKVSDKSEDNPHVKNVNAIIAFVFALFVVASIQTVMYIQDLILGVVLVLIFLFVVLLLFGMVFGDEYKQIFFDGNKMHTWAKWVIGGGIFLVCLGLLFSALGLWDAYIIPWWNDVSQWDYVTIFILIIIVGIMIWVSKDSSKSDKKEDKK